MGAVHIDKRRWERLDKDKWYLECEDVSDLPTTDVPVLSRAKDLYTGKEYYFSSAGEWVEVGSGAETVSTGSNETEPPAAGEGGEG